MEVMSESYVRNGHGSVPCRVSVSHWRQRGHRHRSDMCGPKRSISSPFSYWFVFGLLSVKILSQWEKWGPWTESQESQGPPPPKKWPADNYKDRVMLLNDDATAAVTAGTASEGPPPKKGKTGVWVDAVGEYKQNVPRWEWWCGLRGRDSTGGPTIWWSRN